MRSSAPLTEILSPRSIAVAGASDNPDKTGGRPVFFLKRFGFQGRIYPIDPQRAEVDKVASIDVSPLIVGAKGAGAWVVDALVERQPQ